MVVLNVESIRASVFAEYQPIVDLYSERIVGCEALARWRTADGEVTGIEPMIDAIEADEAYATALTVRMLTCISDELGDVLAARPEFSVNVNLPPIVLGKGPVEQVLEDVGLLPHLHQLVAEITERQAIDELGRSALRVARGLGVRIAIDDFGTGNSGLQQLIGLEVDALKIDRSFVARLGEDRSAERLMRGIAALAAVIHVHLVAEGVERAEQALFLRALGVEKGQGWLWSKAVGTADLIAALGRA